MPVSPPRTAASGRPAPGPLVQRTVVVASRPPPASLIRPVPVSRSSTARPSAPRTRRVLGLAARRDAVARTAARAVAFYAITAALIVAGVAVHEYAHFAAHEGFTVPEFTYSTSVAAAQAELLSVERTQGAEPVLLEQPGRTTIVIFPNTLVQAAGLGLLPSQAYADGGVLASTYFRLDHEEATGLKSRGGQMPADVVAAPLWVAIAVFFAAAAWASWRPNLFNKALLVSYAVQLGDAGHHAEALGVDPGLFYVLSTMAIVVAGLLVALRMNALARNRAGGDPPSGVPGPRPWPVHRTPSTNLSVRAATDKAANRGRAHRMSARPPVTAT